MYEENSALILKWARLKKKEYLCFLIPKSRVQLLLKIFRSCTVFVSSIIPIKIFFFLNLFDKMRQCLNKITEGLQGGGGLGVCTHIVINCQLPIEFGNSKNCFGIMKARALPKINTNLGFLNGWTFNCHASSFDLWTSYAWPLKRN